eukprot:1476839-Rhodomonas_salina.1
MENEIRRTVTEIVTTEMKTKIDKATEAVRDTKGVVRYTLKDAAKEEIEKARESARELIPRDTQTSRLSNLVLDLEEDAVRKMRNFAVHIAKHNSTSSYRMHAVVHQLDLARYVGTLLCESLYTKGTHAVTYMQMRLQRRRTCAALQEAVGFLLEMTHTIKIDTFGQPEGKQLFAKGRKRLLVVGDSSEEQSDRASADSEQSQYTENEYEDSAPAELID